MAKEEIKMDAPAEEQQAEVKTETVVNKRMVNAVAKALSAQLPGCLYHNGWFYVGKQNSAYESGKLTFMLAVEPSVTQQDILDTWRKPLTWLLRQVKKDNNLESRYLETYGKLFKERQPGRCVYTLQFPDRCIDTLDMMVAIPEGVEINDPASSDTSAEGDGTIC